MKVELNKKEQELHAEIEERYNKLKHEFSQPGIASDVPKLIEEAGQRAHQLHLLLKKRGHEPKHHAYMVKNRELRSDDPEFYMHYHPIEDLLKFLQDDHANDDPVDQTIGREFTFRVRSRRRRHEDTYRVKRTTTGWDVRHIAIGGPCDKAGRPFLFKNFQHDLIEYPSGLEGWMEWLWQQAADRGLSPDEVQHALQQLATWVSTTDNGGPQGGIWEGY